MTNQLCTRRNPRRGLLGGRPRPVRRNVGGITYITREEGERLLDKQAQKYLGMSGADFKRQFRAGAIEDPDRPAVIRVSLLIPLAEK